MKVKDFIADIYGYVGSPVLSEYQISVIEKIIESNPKMIIRLEELLSEYDEDEHNWRDYRNSIADCLENEFPNENYQIEQFVKKNP